MDSCDVYELNTNLSTMQNADAGKLCHGVVGSIELLLLINALTPDKWVFVHAEYLNQHRFT